MEEMRLPSNMGAPLARVKQGRAGELWSFGGTTGTLSDGHNQNQRPERTTT